MKYSKYIAAVSILVFMTGLAAASAADMMIFPEESTAEINSFSSHQVTIENLGGYEDVFTLSSTTDEIDIAPRQVELKPGNKETVNVWFNPKSGTEEGEYSFTVTAKSRLDGQRYSVDGVAKVIHDHSVEISTTKSKTSCLGEETVYELEIENTGIQPESFKLSSEAGQLSRGAVNLAEGETTTVDLKILSDVPIERSFNVKASSKTTYANDVEELNFNAETCYDSELTAGKESYDLPANTESVIEFDIANRGTKADNFTVSSNIGEVIDPHMRIDSGDTETAEVAVTPEELGTQQLQLTATSNAETTITTDLNVYNGMKSEVSLGDEQMNVCEQGSAATDVEIENTGEAVETFNLSENIGKLETSEIELEPGESEDVELELQGSAFDEGTDNAVEVTSTASTFGEPVSRAEGQFTVENCWDLKVNLVPTVESAGENMSTIYEMQFENTGTKENTYNLSYDAPPWVSIEPRQLTIAPGEVKKGFIYAGVPFKKKGDVRIGITAEGNQVKYEDELKLNIGQEIGQEEFEEAARNEEDKVSKGPGLSERITGAAPELNDTEKIVGSVVVGAVITLGILFS